MSGTESMGLVRVRSGITWVTLARATLARVIPCTYGLKFVKTGYLAPMGVPRKKNIPGLLC